jgi:hypothetical protein
MRFLKATLAAFFLAAFLWPNTAPAQYNSPQPCSGRAGERPVGKIPASPGVAEIYLCVVDAPQQPGPPPPPKPTTYTNSVYTSAAYHPSVADVWAVWDVRPEDGVHPEQYVMNACTKAVGPGCILLGSVENGTIALARSQLGSIRINAGRTPKEAKAAVLANCTKDGLRCTFLKSFTAQDWFQRPGDKSRMQFYDPSKAKGGLVRKSVGAAVVSNASGPWSRKVWMSGGHPTFEAAAVAALIQCKKDTKSDCQLLATNAHGVIIIGVDSQGNARGFSEQSLPLAQGSMKEKCGKMKLSCSMTLAFDVATPGTQSFDIYASTTKK